jgi:hypothetical protein
MRHAHQVKYVTQEPVSRAVDHHTALDAALRYHLRQEREFAIGRRHASEADMQSLTLHRFRLTSRGLTYILCGCSAVFVLVVMWSGIRP